MTKDKWKDLINYLGKEYSLKTIDYVTCGYRRINNNFDIEIQSDWSKGYTHLRVYVWDITKGLNDDSQALERLEFRNVQEMKDTLPIIVEKYSKKELIK